MKRIFRFGSLSENTICTGIFITSFLIVFRFLYFWRIGISINSSNAEKTIFYVMINYINYLEPIVIITWLKFVCEFLFKLLKRD